jgi:hypothetical protein
VFPCRLPTRTRNIPGGVLDTEGVACREGVAGREGVVVTEGAAGRAIAEEKSAIPLSNAKEPNIM